MNRSLACLSLSLLFPLASVCAAQSLPDGCGKSTVTYVAKDDKNASLSSLDASKARIVFVQSLDGFNSGPVTRFALDGNWVTAVKGKSYSYADTEPGPHQVCAARQGRSFEERSNSGAIKVDAKAGQVTYVEFTIARAAVGPLSSHASGLVTGRTGEDLTAKESDTLDTASIKLVSQEQGSSMLHTYPMSMATRK